MESKKWKEPFNNGYLNVHINTVRYPIIEPDYPQCNYRYRLLTINILNISIMDINN